MSVVAPTNAMTQAPGAEVLIPAADRMGSLSAGETGNPTSNYVFAGTVSGTLTVYDKATVPTVSNFTYNRAEQTGVKGGSHCSITGTTKATNAGTYTATATLDSYYIWADKGLSDTIEPRKFTWKIQPAPITSVTVAAQTYTGSALRPAPTVRAGSSVVPSSGYSVSYASNVNAGTGRVTVTGKGNYAGTCSATFRIATVGIGSASIGAIGTQAYTGRAVCPQPTVRVGGRTLRLGTDYTLSYRNNVRAGTATVVVAGRGNYAGTRTATFRIVAPSVSYRTHVQNVGWQGWRTNGRMSGTSGRGLRLEGINIKLGSMPASGGIQYRTHIQNIGWQGWRSNGAMSGTSGRGLRLEAIEIRLTGQMAKLYDVYYRVHAQNVGWMGWAKNGARSGTAGFGYRLEGIQVVLVPKGQAAPAAPYLGIRQANWRPFRQR